MPRNGSGIYSQPFDDVDPDTTIESAVYNGFTRDVEIDLNQPRPIIAGGTGANNAVEARDNLDAEVAAQAVTNYDSHVWEAGSFGSEPSATGAPVAGHGFFGTALIHPAGSTDYIVLEAYDLNDTVVPGRRYLREKKAGVWGAWQTGISTNDIQLISTDETAALGPTLNLVRKNTTPAAADGLGIIQFYGKNSSLADTVYSRVYSQIANAADGDASGILQLECIRHGANSLQLSIGPEGTTCYNSFSARTYLEVKTEISPAVDQLVGSLYFFSGNTSSSTPDRMYGRIGVIAKTPTAGVEGGALYLSAPVSGALVDQLILAPDRTTIAQDTTFNKDALVLGNIYQAGSTSRIFRTAGLALAGGPAVGAHITYVGGGSEYGMALRSGDGGSTTTAIYFQNWDASSPGTIGVNATTTFYNTSSDRSLKRDLKPVKADLARKIIKNTAIYDFAWRKDGSRAVGVIAQDAVREWESPFTAPSQEGEPWMVDYSKFVPMIIRALQDAYERIEALEAQISQPKEKRQ